MTSLTIREIPPADWLALSPAFRDLTFEQTRAYAEPAAARIGGHARFLAVQRQDEVVALAALRQRNMPGLKRGILWCPAGPLILRHDRPDPSPGDISAILAALRRQLVDQEGHLLRLRLSALCFLDQTQGTQIAATAGFLPTSRAAPYRTFVLDTRLDEEETMRRLHGKWRGQLRVAFKAGLKVETASDQSLSERFDRIYASVRELKGFSSTITPDFHRRCSGEGYHLETFIISREGRDLSAALLVATGSNGNYLFGATNAEGREHRSGFQLTWSVMMRCRELGLHWMDLGGVDRDATPELTTYKERTGATYCEGAGPYQAMPGGLFPRTLLALEGLRARLGKSRGG